MTDSIKPIKVLYGVAVDGTVTTPDEGTLIGTNRILTAWNGTAVDTQIPSEKLVSTALSGKQGTLTFDTTPTASSTNPVTSGGIYTALQDKVTKNTAIAAGTYPVITYDAKGLVLAGSALSASDIPNIAESQVTNLVSDLSNKVDKVTGSRLMLDTEGTKLAGIDTEAQTNAVTALPTASADNAGKVYQYMGTTTADYTQTSFYQCILDGSTYKWTVCNPPTSGGGTWGTIIGTLSDQTDLQAALDAKVTANAAIVAGTYPKITYDAKGLVTSGANLVASDIPDLSASYVPTAPNGTDALLSGNKIQLIYLPDTILGAVKYSGTFDATGVTTTMVSGQSITLTNDIASTYKGYYLVASAANTVVVCGYAIGELQIGDWLVSNGTTWDKIDNSDKVSGVKGNAESTYRTGQINLTPANIGAVAVNASITAGTYPKITYDSKGLVTAGTALVASDVPNLAESQVTGLVADLASKVDANADITAGTYTKVSVDTKGLVTSGASLSASDVPDIAESQVTGLTADLASKVDENASITAGTYPKITYDAKGLVTSGAALIASDIPTIAQSQVSGLVAALAAKQLTANLVTAFQTTPDDTHYPSEKLTYDQLSAKLTANTAITAGTYPKITYDANGLVTAGASLIASDIPNIAESQVTNLTTDLSNRVVKNASITAATNTKITYDAKGLVTAGTALIASDVPNLAESQITGLVADLALKQTTANLVTAFQTTPDNTHYISEKLSYDQLALKLTANTAITAGTYPKITYDANGLVTAGSVLVASDIPDIAESQVTGLVADLASKVDANTDITANTADYVFPAYDTKGLITGKVANAYEKTIYLNGANGFGVFSSQYATDYNIIAPMTYGTAGQLLMSGGDATAPAWQTIDTAPTSASTKAVTSGGVYTAVNTKVTANTAITAGTYPKITYDAKGLVTAGAVLTASDIPNITESQVTGLVSDLAGKQSTLTFDTTPTASSTNPVTSGGILTALNGKVDENADITANTADYNFPSYDTKGLVTGSVATALRRTLSINGTAYNLYTNVAGTITPIFAPLETGTAGQLLASAGSGAPTWQTMDTAPTASSTKAVTSGGVLTALNDKATTASVTSEASTRASADTTLQTNITSEASTRASADTTLQTNIDAKVARAGDTMTGALVAASGTLTTAQVRNITISTADPSGGSSGDVWLVYAS